MRCLNSAPDPERQPTGCVARFGDSRSSRSTRHLPVRSRTGTRTEMSPSSLATAPTSGLPRNRSTQSPASPCCTTFQRLRQLALLAEAFRLLRPTGVLVGSDSLASNELHHFHREDTYNPIDPARLLIGLQTLGFVQIAVRVGNELTFTAQKPESK